MMDNLFGVAAVRKLGYTPPGLPDRAGLDVAPANAIIAENPAQIQMP